MDPDPVRARRSLLLAVTIVALLLATGVLQYRERERQERAETAPHHLAKGTQAPELSAPTPSGPDLRLSDLQGKAVVVSFWASWCLPCRVEMPEVAELVDGWNHAKDKKIDTVYVAINYKEEPAATRLIFKEARFKGVRFAMDGDGAIAKAWKVEMFPTTYLVSPEGEILEAQVGYDPSLRYRLTTALGQYIQSRASEKAKP